MTKLRCAHCGTRLIPAPQVPNQAYCSKANCQKERRRQSMRKRGRIKSTAEVTSASLIRNYQREVERQKLIVKKSDFAQQRLMFVIGALRSLLSNENFTTLLRAEKLDTLPTFLAERVWPTGHAA